MDKMDSDIRTRTYIPMVSLLIIECGIFGLKNQQVKEGRW